MSKKEEKTTVTASDLHEVKASDMTLMGSLDKIVTTLISRDTTGATHLQEQKLPDAKDALEYIARKFDISETQAMLFALMFDRAGYLSCTTKAFAEYLGVTSLRAYSYYEDYEVLRKKWLIRMTQEGMFRIPRMVITETRKDKVFKKPDFKNLDTAGLVSQIGHFVAYVTQSEYSVEEAVEDAQAALSENPGTGMSRAYDKYQIDDCTINEKFLFFLLIISRLENGMENMSVAKLTTYFDDDTYISLRDRIFNECLSLQKKNLVVFETCDGIVTKDRIRINEDVLTEICQDDPVLLESGSPAAGVISPESIVKKKLFFTDEVQKNITMLSGVLEEHKYDELKFRMRGNGMREGFTCLFYGPPGTGKTESVYQLAKESGRELIEVDVAALMNCYVGETEKNTRRLFENYRRRVHRGSRAPILLFNEADAILGRRMKGAEKSVDRMSNSVQNIILQEMEKLDGIMIATTNLTENLDSAFERRFLYKIKFENPTAELRGRIWSEMLPDLKDEEVGVLSKQYDFSGGQIENIARKRFITTVLGGKDVPFEQICDFCKEEVLQENDITKIGF